MANKTKVKLEAFRVVPNFNKTSTGGFDFFWKVKTIGHWTPSFNIEYATEDESSTWTTLLPAPITGFFALNLAPKQSRLYIPWIFRLKIFDGAELLFTSDLITVETVLNKHDFLIWREIVRRHYIKFNKYNGRPGVLLRKKMVGEKCTKCSDEILGDTVNSECKICYGTNYIGGYYTPIAMPGDWLSAPPSGYNITLEVSGPEEKHVTRIEVMPEPGCEFMDIWVDAASNYRYQITKIDLTEFRGVPTSQLLEVTKLPESNVVYSLPLDLSEYLLK